MQESGGARSGFPSGVGAGALVCAPSPSLGTLRKPLVGPLTRTDRDDHDTAAQHHEKDNKPKAFRLKCDWLRHLPTPSIVLLPPANCSRQLLELWVESANNALTQFITVTWPSL